MTRKLILTFTAFALVAHAADEQKLEKLVQTALQSDPALRWHPLEVAVVTNKVILEGEINTPAMRQRVSTLVGTVPGVREIDNRVVVRPEKRPDESIAADVTAAFVYDTATDSFEIEVAVSNAVVRLSGAVQSPAERDLAEMIAGTVRGVRAVENQLEYRPKAFRSDRELKREILNSLRYDARLAGRVFDVEVNFGKVQISGTVATPAERLRARMHAQPPGHRSLDHSGLVIGTGPLVAAPRYQDKSIANALKTAIAIHPRLNSERARIRVTDGVVTLFGEVDHLKAHREAERLASDISGVRRVYNLLKLVPKRSPDDKTLRSTILRHLTRHPLAENSEISVEVTGGVVQLTGSVDTHDEKWAAADAASVVQGVVEIRNRLKVRHPRRFPRPAPNKPL